jgi:hypothetical protein
MVTLGRHLGCLPLVVALLISSAGSTSANARLREQPCGVASSLASPPTPRPHYTMSVHVLPGLRAADGQLAVSFTAPQKGGIDHLVFRLWPNADLYARSGAHLFVSRVREAHRTLRVSYPNPTTLVIARRLAAGERVVVSMNWRLALSQEIGQRMKGRARSARLASFFPLLAWDGSGWALDPPPKLLNAEAWTTPTADFDVRVTQPRGLRVFASGSDSTLRGSSRDKEGPLQRLTTPW